ncbi:MAG: glycosyltransferase family 2 protein [Paracoccaceae bacterium]
MSDRDVRELRAAPPSEAVRLSVVAPAFNEGPGIEPFLDRLSAHLAALGLAYEVIIVDDGSRDDTAARVAARAARDPAVKLVRLSRNFGKEAALNAGLAHAAGAAVVQIDSDLQHPPELVAELVAEWQRGAEIVYARRRSREGESLVRRLAARAFYGIFGAISEIRLMEGLGDFILLDRKVVDAMLRLPERERFTKGLYAWVGFRVAAVPFDVAPRAHGRSRFRLGRLMRFGMDAVTAFGSFPLRVWTYVGLTLAVLSMSYGVYIAVRTLVFGIDVPGYASLMVAICFLSGVQLLGLGVIGEYLGRVLVEVKQRPLYLVRETVGFDAEEGRADAPLAAESPAPPRRAAG